MERSAWLRDLLYRLRCWRRPAWTNPPVVGFYWGGGVARGHSVKEVSPTGAYLVTPDRWYRGTVISLMFQYDMDRLPANGTVSVRMRGKVVAQKEDGVLLEFVYLNKQERRTFRRFLEGVPA